MANESALANTVASGRTGVITNTTAYGVLCAGTTATGAIQNAGAGTATHALTSNGAAALPTFQAYSGGSGEGVNLWANLDGTGTISLRDSFNIASVADDGTGEYTFTIDTDFANVNYSVSASTTWSDSQSAFLISNPFFNSDAGGTVEDPLVGSFPVATGNVAGINFQDSEYLCVAAWGDQ